MDTNISKRKKQKKFPKLTNTFIFKLHSLNPQHSLLFNDFTIRLIKNKQKFK